MPWSVRFEDEFEQEFGALPLPIREAMMAAARLLKDYGPQLGRPHVDTLKGSAFPNMKEFRFNATNGVWRVAFAFDPARDAILLIAGDKSGVSAARFYRTLIHTADRRYAGHLARLHSADPDQRG
jgi:hypothetical protein